MFDRTITLFNRYHSRLGDTWYPHVLHKAQVTTDKASIIAKYGAQSSDNASIILNYKKDGDSKILGGLPYLAPKLWAHMLKDDLHKYITINDDASQFDFVMIGDYGSTDPILDDDYVDGFYNYMNREYDYVYAITSVGGGYTLIPHFEILAR